jgi:hypothetical protein
VWFIGAVFSHLDDCCILRFTGIYTHITLLTFCFPCFLEAARPSTSALRIIFRTFLGKQKGKECVEQTPQSEHKVYSYELKSKVVYFINNGLTKYRSVQ